MDFQFPLEIVYKEPGKNESLLTHQIWKDKTQISLYILNKVKVTNIFRTVTIKFKLNINLFYTLSS